MFKAKDTIQKKNWKGGAVMSNAHNKEKQSKTNINTYLEKAWELS